MDIPSHDNDDSELQQHARNLGRPDSTNPNSSKSGEPVKHVPVRDASGYSNKSEMPLSAYMISPRYLPRDRRRTLPPKRPLGVRPRPEMAAAARPKKPVVRSERERQAVFYSQAATFGLADRIRRPRMQLPAMPAKAAPAVQDIQDEETQQSKRDKLAAYIAAGTAAITGRLVLIKDSLLDGGAYIVRRVRQIAAGPSSVSYSATAGARYRRFGLPGEYWRVGLPLAVLLLLAVSVAGNINNGGNNGSGNGAGTPGANGGNSTLRITPTAAASGNSNGGSKGGTASSGNHKAGGGTGSTAAGSGASSPSGSSIIYGSPNIAGGRGGGAPSVSTGSNSLSQATPAPVGSSPSSGGSGSTGSSSGTSGSGGTSGSSGSSSGSGSILPVTTGTPLPVTVTVPGTNTSAGGKTLEQTTPVTGTLN